MISAAVLVIILCLASVVMAEETVRKIVFSGGTALLDGGSVPEYDYTWHADPDTVHDEVKNAPAEYYTGTKPSGEDAVYIAHDIFYFPEVPVDGFRKVRYDEDTEWAYYYPVEEYKDYIWALLPVQRNSVPERMMHSAEEAYNNPVLHITEPGIYELSGVWQGQIWVDLGDQDDTFTDENAKVTLILNGIDVTCTVAPAVVFYSVYEADNTWEDRESYGPEVDITDAGAKVVIADDSENTFTGTNVYRMLKAKYKDDNSTDEVKVQKKMRKTDGAFYSYRSMIIDGGEKGSGVLNIISGNEGLNSELHLMINGGKVNIQSQDDGVNVNEDNVSVLTVNGGELHIVAGLGAEGDGLDSNGYLVINGGVVISAAKPFSDSGLDSDRGSFIHGGYVVATGSTMDWPESDSSQVTMNLQFAADQASDEAIIVTDQDGKVIFAYDPDKDETAGSNNRGYKGAVISCPEFKVGEMYHVYIGGDVEGSEVNGLYDAATVTGFSGAVRQAFTGTDVGGFGRFGMGGPRPDDGDFPGRPEDGGRPEPPADGRPGEGGFPGERPEPPAGGRPGGPMGGPESQFEDIEGFTMNEDGSVSITTDAAEKILAILTEQNPETAVTVEEIAAISDMRDIFGLIFDRGFGPGPMGGPGGNFERMGPGNEGEPSIDFFMNDTVNAFSGVSDEGAN